MFKKIKEKLAEEMKQSPARLQAGMQQLAQVVSPAPSNSSIQDISVSNDNFSLTEETDTDTPRNSPANHGFQSVNLNTSADICEEISRRSSTNSVMSDASFLFPPYENTTNNILLSDMEQSASEVDDSINLELDRVSKEQLYAAYRNALTKYKKYRSRYRELGSHYQDILRNKTKLESLLEDTQDKAIRRIAELKEQCELEQQAKTHLEEALRNDIEEKDCLINSLNTKITLIQNNSKKNETNPEDSNTELLIDFTNDESLKTQNENLMTENEELKKKITALDHTLKEYKSNYELEKKKFDQEKSVLESNLNANILQLTEEINSLKKREEESAYSLAENKLSIYRELEEKEEQIKKLTQNIESSIKIQESISETFKKYKTENEKTQAVEKHKFESITTKLKEEQFQNIELLKKLKDLEVLANNQEQKSLNESNLTKQLNKELEKISKELIELRNANEILNQSLEKEKLEKDQMQELSNELHKSLQSLTGEVSQLQSYLKKKENEIDNKNLELNLLTEEHITCKIIVDDLKAKIQEIRSQVSQLVTEKQAQSKKIKEYKNTVNLLRQDCEQLIETIKITVNHGKQDLTKLGQYFSRIVSQFNVESQEIKPKLDELNRLQSQNEKLAKQCIQLKTEWETRTSQVHQLILLIDDLEMKQQKILDDNKMLRNTLETNNMSWLEREEEYKNKITEQTKKCESLSRNLSELSAQLEVSDKKILEQKNNLQLLSNSNTTIKQTKKQHEQQVVKMLNDKVIELEKQNVLLNTQIGSLKHELKAGVQEKTILTEEINKQAESYMKLEKLNKAQIDTINSLKSKVLLYLEKKFNDLEKNDSRVDETISNLELKAQQYGSKTSRKLEELKFSDSKHQIEEKMSFDNVDLVVSKKIEKLLLDKEALDTENIILKRNNEELTLKTEEFEKNIATQNEMMDKYKNQLKHFNIENDESKKQIFELNAAKEKMVTENKLLKDQNNAQIKNCESLDKMMKEQIETISKLENKIRSIDLEFNNVLNSNAELDSSLKTMEESCNTIEKLNKIKLTIAKKESEITQLKQEIEELNKNLTTYKFKVKDLETKHSRTEQTLEENIKRYNELKIVITEKQTLEDKLDELKTENEKLLKINAKISSSAETENNLKLTLNEKDKLVESLELKLQNLTAEYNTSKSRIVELSSVFEDAKCLRKSFDELNMKMNDKSEELTRVLEVNEKLSNSIEKLKEENIKIVDQLKKNESEKVSELESLKDVNNKLTLELRSREETEKQLEAQLDETLVTFQTKESQMRNLNEELKKNMEDLKNELTVNNNEHSMRLKQLAKEFQAQLHDKDEELHAALEKRFDQQQSYETELIRQYKDQLKDFQVELTIKSEQIENLIQENKQNVIAKEEEIMKLTESIELIQNSHLDEIKENENKWKSLLEQKKVQLEALHTDEINELTNEWQNERKTNAIFNLSPEELENTSRVAIAAVQSNTGSFHTLQQTVLSQKRELAELRKLVKLRHDTLEDSTEIEYLRNILYEYMMGKETLVLAKVIAAVVKFDQDQTSKIIKKEEDKLTLLGSLGLT